ncbi:MAG: GNAT family N-acetyltransferase [Lachnospiraceae bacterium]
MEIRLLQQHEVRTALHLVWDVFAEYIAPTYTRVGVEEFRNFILYDKIMASKNRGELVLWGCFDGQELLGVSAMKNIGHINMLYVRTEYQRQGIGKQLFEKMKEYATQVIRIPKLTLYAAPSAVVVYEHMGLYATGPEQQHNGIRYIPMEFTILITENRPGELKKKNRTPIYIAIGVLVGSILLAIITLGVLTVSHVGKSIYESRTAITELPNRPGVGNKLEELIPEENETDKTVDEKITDYDAYKADGLSYDVTEETYAYSDQGKRTHIDYNVAYPQLENLEDGEMEQINTILKECAMETVNAQYLNPTEEMKESILKQQQAILASEVTYKITYMDQEFMSVVFQDHYFDGNQAEQYLTLRTRNINLKDGTLYHIEDIIDGTQMAGDYRNKISEKYDARNEAEDITKKQYATMLQGETIKDTNLMGMADFFVTEDGIEVGVSYEYMTGETGTIGWMTVPYDTNELKTYAKDSEFWKMKVVIDE